MPDREKVIDALEECTTSEDCINCSYHEFHGNGCFQKLMKDALAVLKREPVEPITQSSVYDPDTWFYVCGSCKKSVIDRGDRFCRWCGQAVKWE